MTDDSMGPVTIGAREIYDAVIRLGAAVDRLNGQYDEVKHDIVDHEARIRSLEKARWPLPSLAILVSVASLAMAVLVLLR